MKASSALKRLREQQALSLRELAKKSGVSHVAISQIERGERKPRLSTLGKLADALNVEPPVLVTGSSSLGPGLKRILYIGWEPREYGDVPDSILGITRVRVIYEDDSTQEYDSALEAYVAEEDAGESILELDRLAVAPEIVDEILEAPRSKLASSDPEEIKEARDLVLSDIQSILDDLATNNDALEELVSLYKALPESYYENPVTAKRIARLGWSLAAQQSANQKEAAKAVRELRRLHAVAVLKLERMEHSAGKERIPDQKNQF